MITYWPMAEVIEYDEIERKHVVRSQFTYDGASTIENAMKCFDCWRNGYDMNISRAWIDVSDGDGKIGEIEVGYAPIKYKEITKS